MAQCFVAEASELAGGLDGKPRKMIPA